VLIRDAAACELSEIGQIRITAYRSGGHLSENSGYAPHLRDLGADGAGHVLVAVAQAGDAGRVPDGRIVGTVMLQLWPRAGRVVTGPDEAEIRALAVLPEVQGYGVGRALLHAATGRARTLAVRHLVLFTQPDMLSAQHLYEKAGFARLPERDWSPGGPPLIAYGLRLRLRVA
jgi:ribosomal protein S18 acetylase RimI-like enzyme